MNIGQKIIREIDKWATQSQITRWSTYMVKDPQDHRQDRMLIRDQNEKTICKARFEIWKNSMVMAFTADVTNNKMHRLFMRDKWDERGAASAILACLATYVIPTPADRFRELKFSMTAPFHVKVLQDRIRKDQDWTMPQLPPLVRSAVTLLKVRYRSLSDQSVEERLNELRDSLRFLISKDVPWERVRETWKEEECRLVLES